MKTISNQISLVENQIDAKSTTEDTITFSEPLKIVGTGRKQWNGTIYDLNSTNVDSWDGLITQDHGTKLSDVIGKATKVFKNESGIFISGIKYAIKENPAAILAMNLLKGGFATGFSCETIGPDPEEGVWKNHRVCGLSQVSHPNSSECYAVVSNSIEEARKNNLNTSELDDILAKLVKNDETLEKEDEEEIKDDNLEEATLSVAEINENEIKIKQLNELMSEYDDLIEILENELKREEFEEKLNSLDKILNGGPGSGNHAPGQGQGVGKPRSGAPSNYAKSVKKKKLDELREKRDKLSDDVRFWQRQAKRSYRKDDEDILAGKQKELEDVKKEIKETSKKDARDVGEQVLEERKAKKSKEDRAKELKDETEEAIKKDSLDKYMEIAKSLKENETTRASYKSEDDKESTYVYISKSEISVIKSSKKGISSSTEEALNSSFGDFESTHSLGMRTEIEYDAKTGKETGKMTSDYFNMTTKDGINVNGKLYSTSGNYKSYERSSVNIETERSGLSADARVRIDENGDGSISSSANFYNILDNSKQAIKMIESAQKFAESVGLAK